MSNLSNPSGPSFHANGGGGGGGGDGGGGRGSGPFQATFRGPTGSVTYVEANGAAPQQGGHLDEGAGVVADTQRQVQLLQEQRALQRANLDLLRERATMEERLSVQEKATQALRAHINATGAGRAWDPTPRGAALLQVISGVSTGEEKRGGVGAAGAAGDGEQKGLGQGEGALDGEDERLRPHFEALLRWLRWLHETMDVEASRVAKGKHGEALRRPAPPVGGDDDDFDEDGEEDDDDDGEGGGSRGLGRHQRGLGGDLDGDRDGDLDGSRRSRRSQRRGRPQRGVIEVEGSNASSIATSSEGSPSDSSDAVQLSASNRSHHRRRRQRQEKRSSTAPPAWSSAVLSPPRRVARPRLPESVMRLPAARAVARAARAVERSASCLTTECARSLSSQSQAVRDRLRQVKRSSEAQVGLESRGVGGGRDGCYSVLSVEMSG